MSRSQLFTQAYQARRPVANEFYVTFSAASSQATSNVWYYTIQSVSPGSYVISNKREGEMPEELTKRKKFGEFLNVCRNHKLVLEVLYLTDERTSASVMTEMVFPSFMNELVETLDSITALAEKEGYEHRFTVEENNYGKIRLRIVLSCIGGV